MDTLTQKQIDRLDKIGKQNGVRLHMPPFDNMIHPFFAIRKKDGYPRSLLSHLESFKTISLKDDKNYYILVRG